jgi:hypothetical protein
LPQRTEFAAAHGLLFAGQFHGAATRMKWRRCALIRRRRRLP